MCLPRKQLQTRQGLHGDDISDIMNNSTPISFFVTKNLWLWYLVAHLALCIITDLYVSLVLLSCFRPYSLNVRFNSQINMAVSVTVRNTTNTRKASPSLWHNLLPSLVWIFSSGRRLIVPNSAWSTENKNRVTVESVAKQETCLGGANKGEIYAARETGYGPLGPLGPLAPWLLNPALAHLQVDTGREKVWKGHIGKWWKWCGFFFHH